MLDALLAARSRLGSPASRAELDRYLSGRDAALRTAAIRGLAYVPEPGAVTELGRYATTDPDLAVRTAAIEALGQSHKADALSVLAKTFADPAREVKQKSAQAIVEIGGPAADATLTELALQGDSIDSKKYAALLLLVTHGRDDPVVKGLLASNPFPAAPPRYVRALLYEYHFTDWASREGAWWRRQPRGLYAPPVSLR